jgi:hypothetical protein
MDPSAPIYPWVIKNLSTEDIRMRKTSVVTVMILANLALGMTPSFAAAKVYPWCARYSSTAGECSFDTFQQCLDDVSGIGGGCTSNPSYNGPPAR